MKKEFGGVGENVCLRDRERKRVEERVEKRERETRLSIFLSRTTGFSEGKCG